MIGGKYEGNREMKVYMDTSIEKIPKMENP